MMLILGGAFQGKQDFALQQTGCAAHEVGGLGMPIVNNLEQIIFDLLAQGIEPWQYLQQQFEQQPPRAVICNEVGCGLVPADPLERVYREQVGRIQCRLAQQADSVYRVQAGLGRRLK